MGHLNQRSYVKLAGRLGQYVPGAYVSETLVEILRHLVTEEEARLCSLMPLRTVPAEALARVWGMSTEEAQETLGRLAGKGVVFAFANNGSTTYALAPPVLGFVEFSLMRTDGKLDSKALSELYHRYCQVEGDFIRQQGSAHPGLSRVFPGEDVLEEVSSEVLSYDRVSAGIDEAVCITTGLCYCRHKMEHMGQACDAPMDVCLTFNDVARYLSDHGIAREISKDEAHAIVRDCMDRGLVQVGDNTRDGLAIICNCCACCCDLLLGYRRFGSTGLVTPSGFVAAVDPGECTGCGVCEESCPAAAVEMDGEAAVVDPEVCLGCGVCARFCADGACRMGVRTPRPYVPRSFVEKTMLAAIDAGKLGNYLFDDQTSRSHAVLRGLLNGALRLAPVKRALRSRPVRALVSRVTDAEQRR